MKWNRVVLLSWKDIRVGFQSNGNFETTTFKLLIVETSVLNAIPFVKWRNIDGGGLSSLHQCFASNIITIYPCTKVSLIQITPLRGEIHVTTKRESQDSQIGSWSCLDKNISSQNKFGKLRQRIFSITHKTTRKLRTRVFYIFTTMALLNIHKAGICYLNEEEYDVSFPANRGLGPNTGRGKDHSRIWLAQLSLTQERI